jgi:hypothetical protein
VPEEDSGADTALCRATMEHSVKRFVAQWGTSTEGHPHGRISPKGIVASHS